jgi:hypothetical protein
MNFTHRTLIALAVWAAIARPAPGVAQEQAATTVQLPTFGVSVDAQGVLALQQFEDPTGQLRRQRLAAAQQAVAPDLWARSKLRKVSLNRLEQAIARTIAEGKPPEEAMLFLAGLQRVQYVFCYPEAKELVIAGPAEGWAPDPAGRIVGATSGLPVIELRDLVVALRAYPAGAKRPAFVGCSITPRPDGLAKMQKYQRSVPKVIQPEQLVPMSQQMARGMSESLGPAEIQVFGISPQTHFAHVLIEADYRMKRIGIGLERPPIELSSYLDLLTGDAGGTLQRWWLVPNYAGIKVSGDGLALELVGQGVQLQTEDKVIGPQGQLSAGRKSNRASELFALGFTRKYERLAAASPVFAQLRSLIDLLIVAAFMQEHDYAEQARWPMVVFADEQQFRVQTERLPELVPAAVNSAIKGNRVVAVAGGGVSIQASETLLPERLHNDTGGKLQHRKDQLHAMPADRWWWD